MPRKSDKPRDPTQIVALQVRIREDLRAQIESAASASGNSMNSEIAERLATSLREDEVLGSGPTRQMMAQIADTIALIEDRTGKGWTADLATFEAVRLLIEDTVKRRRPPRENLAEAIACMEQETKDSKRERELKDFLVKCGALVMRQVNALLAVVEKRDFAPYWGETEETEWHHPDGPEVELTGEEREAIRRALDEFRTLQQRHPQLLEQLRKLQEPMERAERAGAEIFAEISGQIDADTARVLLELEAAHGP